MGSQIRIRSLAPKTEAVEAGRRETTAIGTEGQGEDFPNVTSKRVPFCWIRDVFDVPDRHRLRSYSTISPVPGGRCESFSVGRPNGVLIEMSVVDAGSQFATAFNIPEMQGSIASTC